MTVVEAGNFSSAARRLGLTQPAVSARINHLERELATALLVREARRVLPTPSGQLLYAKGQLMLRQLESVKQQIQEEAGAPVGPLLLSAGEASGVYVAPLLLGAFRNLHQGVQPVLQIRRISQTTSDLIEQKVRLGILPSVQDDARLEGIPLCQSGIRLIVPANHPFATRDWVEAKELEHEPFLIREGDSRVNSHLSRVLEPVGVRFQDLQGVMQLGNNEAIKVAVAAGLGVGFVSTLCLRKGMEGLRVVRVRGLKGEWTYQLARRVEHPASFAEQLFWEFCQSPAVRAMLDAEFGCSVPSEA